MSEIQELQERLAEAQAHIRALNRDATATFGERVKDAQRWAMERDELEARLAAVEQRAAELQEALERLAAVETLSCPACEGSGPHEQVLQMVAVARAALARTPQQAQPLGAWPLGVSAERREAERSVVEAAIEWQSADNVWTAERRLRTALAALDAKA